MFKLKFQDLSDEKLFALYITLVLHIGLFIGLIYVKSLIPEIPNEIKEDLIEIEFFEEIIEEEPLKEEAIIEKELTHQAKDLNEELPKEDVDPSENIEKEVEKISSSEEHTSELLNELNESDQGFESPQSSVSGNGLTPTKSNIGKKEKKKEKEKYIASSRSSFITYRVMYRKCTVDPNPIYLCEKSGKIVLNIVVNKKGKVIRAQVNPSLSSRYDKCLWETAVKYAKKTRFTEYKYAGNEQGGSIIYEFQGQ